MPNDTLPSLFSPPPLLFKHHLPPPNSGSSISGCCLLLYCTREYSRCLMGTPGVVEELPKRAQQVLLQYPLAVPMDPNKAAPNSGSHEALQESKAPLQPRGGCHLLSRGRYRSGHACSLGPLNKAVGIVCVGRRIASLETRQNASKEPAPPKVSQSSSLFRGLSKEDQAIAERLERLKMETKPSSDSQLNNLNKGSDFLEENLDAQENEKQLEEEKSRILEEAMAELKQDNIHQEQVLQMARRLACLKGEDPNSVSAVNYKPPDSDEETEEEAVQRILKQLSEEAQLDEASNYNIPPECSASLQKPKVKKTLSPAITKKSVGAHDSDDEELPWCCICNHDATIRCLSCDDDLYCSRCFRMFPEKLPVFLLPIFCTLAFAADGESFGETCLGKFTTGTPGFVLDTDDSVQRGATFLASPNVTRWTECLRACCLDSHCNLAMVEGPHEELTHDCFLFDCIYKQSFVCKFIKKDGFANYILTTVSNTYLSKPPNPEDADKPPIAKPGPTRVIQPNETLTLTGIESGDDHEIASYQWSLVHGDPSVVLKKTDKADEVLVSNLKPGVYILQLTVTDSSGQMGSANVSIYVLTAEQSTNCKTECTGSHYKCANGCCIDKYLECDGEKNCDDGSDEASCASIRDKFGRLLDVQVEKDKGKGSVPCIHSFSGHVLCTDPPLTGPCRAHFKRWWYDPYNRDCHPFTFGGCDGNENNFLDADTCRRACHGVTEKDVFSRGLFERQEGDHSKSGIIAVAILLAVAIAIVLAILGYFLLKSRKEQPRHQAVSSNGSTLSTTEDTVRLVYNTTTKPI
ncbi:SPIT1 inhibitor, partial [Polypterus senegalus]